MSAAAALRAALHRVVDAAIIVSDCLADDASLEDLTQAFVVLDRNLASVQAALKQLRGAVDA